MPIHIPCLELQYSGIRMIHLSSRQDCLPFKRLILQDIEDKNEQLELQRKQIEEATQSKLHFYTTISHDFLTPLTLIIEPVELLLQNHQMKHDQYDLLVMCIHLDFCYFELTHFLFHLEP